MSYLRKKENYKKGNLLVCLTEFCFCVLMFGIAISIFLYKK